jgi:hypothetical protein
MYSNPYKDASVMDDWCAPFDFEEVWIFLFKTKHPKKSMLNALRTKENAPNLRGGGTYWMHHTAT